MKSFWADFKKFITKGNIIDLAVAVVIGGAFNKIVTSFVNDVVMPLVSLLVGGLNVSDWKWVIKEAILDEAGAVVTAETALKYGVFIQAVIDFLIVAFCIFVALRLIMKAKNKLHEKEIAQAKAEAEAKAKAEAEKAPAETVESILKDIRDQLKAGK